MQDERRAAGDVQDHDIVAGNGAHANPVQAAAAPGADADRLFDPPAGQRGGKCDRGGASRRAGRRARLLQAGDDEGDGLAGRRRVHGFSPARRGR